MLAALLFFAAAGLAVKQDQTPLRDGCSTEDHVIATLAAGTPLEVRYAIADGSNCFSVTASVDGKQVQGYVPGNALSGVDAFERERAEAGDPDTIRMMSPIVEKLSKEIAAQVSDPELARALQLAQAGQPAQALHVLQSLLPRYKNDPNVLLLAGLAAYRSDDVRGALEYWKHSLELQPNDMLSGLYAKAKRETEADKSAEKLYGNRVLLRYEGEVLPPDTARAVVAMLDSEVMRISSQLGCPAEEKIIAIVQSPASYYKTTGSAEWSDGQYDGRIHVALLEGPTLGPRTRRALAHEIVHACLTTIPSGTAPWPSWLQEGIAQKLAGDHLPEPVRSHLREMAADHTIPKLENLGHDWLRLKLENARTAYNVALAAADELFANYQNYGLRNILNNPDRLPQITADLDKRLGL